MADVLGRVWLFQLFGEFRPPARTLLRPMVFRLQDSLHRVVTASLLPSACLLLFSCCFSAHDITRCRVTGIFGPGCCVAVLTCPSQGAQVTYVNILKPVLNNISSSGVVAKADTLRERTAEANE